MLRIIGHSLTRRWVQSLSTLTAVVFSVGIFFAIYLLYLSVSLGLDAGKKRLGADLLVIPADSIVEPEMLLFTGQPYNVYMNREIEGQIAKIPGVRRTTPQFFAQTLNETCCTLIGATRLIGFDQRSDWLVLSWIKRLPGGGLAPDQVIVGSGVKGFSGQTATILKKKVRVAAVLEPTATSLDYSVLMPIDATRDLVKTIPYFQTFLGNQGDVSRAVSAVLVDVDNDFDRGTVVKAIERTGRVRVIQASVVLQRIKDQMDVLFLVMLCAGTLAAVSSIIQLFARFFSLAWDRKGEWGLYRALGATRRDLKLLVAGEALFLTWGGVAAGLVLGYCLNAAVLHLLERQAAFPLLDPSPMDITVGILAISGAFTLLGLIAALIPGIKSAGIDPSSAMAMGDID
ncbi:ABC transporter permease [Geotalea sp. SG265]|uniref:ABC transporter permease n=1 Tax=Geotalea sp. SG265 TaxID=2922867 RepID=UPI001FAFF0D0|nr:ABC transporter permease [Geotalea sp. SG265]